MTPNDNRGAVHTRSPRAVLTAASAAQVAVSFVTFGLPAIGPELRRDFGLSLPELGAVLTAGFLGSALSLLAAGVAVDRLGSRTSMTRGHVPGARARSWRPRCADTTLGLAAALVVFGIGSSVVTIAGVGALFRAYPPERRAWALGVRQMAVPLGGMIGAVLVPLLEALGGVSAVLYTAAGGVGLAGACVRAVSGGLGARAQAGGRLPDDPARARNAAAPPRRRFYIVVLQALLVYAVPAARAAGLSAFAAWATFFAIQAAAGVARVVWGRVADRGGGARRVRTLVEAGRRRRGRARCSSRSRSIEGPRVAVPAAVVFGFGALGWNAIVYVSAGERAPPELAGRSVRRRRDGRLSGSRHWRRRRSARSRSTRAGTCSGWPPPALALAGVGRGRDAARRCADSGRERL